MWVYKYIKTYWIFFFMYLGGMFYTKIWFRRNSQSILFTWGISYFFKGVTQFTSRISLFGDILYFNTSFGRPFRGVRPWVEGITRSGSALSYHLTRHPSSGNAQGSYPKRIYDVYTEESRYPLYTYLRRCSASRVNRAALFSAALSLPVEAFSCAHEQTRAHTSSCHHLFVSSHSQFNWLDCRLSFLSPGTLARLHLKLFSYSPPPRGFGSL